MNKHTIGSLIGIILVVFIGGYLLNMFMGGGLFSRIEGNANMENKLTFYYMNGCSHCDKFNQFGKNLQPIIVELLNYF